MIKNSGKKSKCANINCSDDYKILTDNLSNPYCYNFGKGQQSLASSTFQKLHNKVNPEFFTKR